MYIFFQYKRSEYLQVENPEGLSVVIKHPFTESIHSFIWRIFSFLLGGTYCKWQLLKGSKIISEAEVISWLPIFRFMPRTGIQVGPCRTVPEERGHGYYPYLLTQIVRNDPDKDYYMIVEESNSASIRGVLKAGFRPLGVGHKNHIGQYVMEDKSR